MSAKHSNKKKKAARIALWVLICVLVVVLLGVLLIWWALAFVEGMETPNESTTTQSTAATDPLPTAAPDVVQPTVGAMEDSSVDLGRGLKVINIGAYTGAYVEDGTNEIVSGVLMIIVTNAGEEAIEYARISVPTPAGTAEFSLSTLLPGDSAVLLEQNRMPHTGQENLSEAAVDSVAIFRQTPSLCQDRLQLQVLDGAINVVNISGQDITGDILIYYKNSAADLYYGGITYRVRIEGGMKAGEIKQLMASHFSASGSKIVFVVIN